MILNLYGIANCDQVKKARAWLKTWQEDNAPHIVVNFYDFKKSEVTPALITGWLVHLDWQQLINRRGTTWRQLPQSEQLAVIDAPSAIHCMVNSPSVIKRPVLVIQHDQQTEMMVGFSEENYQRYFLPKHP